MTADTDARRAIAEDLDDTLIVYISGDNGSSPEGSPNGTPNEVAQFNSVEVPVEAQLKAWDKNELITQDLLLALHKEKAMEKADQINSAQDMAPMPTEEAPAAPVAAPAAAAAAPAAQPEKVKVKTKTAEGSTKQKDKKKKEAKPANDGWN